MADRIIPSVNSLVKYDNPVLVTKHPEKKLPPIKVGVHSFDSLWQHHNWYFFLFLNRFLDTFRFSLELQHQHLLLNLVHLQLTCAKKLMKYSIQSFLQKNGKKMVSYGDNRYNPVKWFLS